MHKFILRFSAVFFLFSIVAFNVRGGENARLTTDRHRNPAQRLVHADSYDSLAILVERNVAVNVTGFLVAIVEGYYEQEGLPPVSAILQDVNSTVLDGFFSGRVQFATNMLPRVCRYAADGYDMAVLAQLIPHSTFGIAIRTDLNPNINDFKDFNGKKIAVYYRDEENFYIPFSALDVNVTMVPVQTHGSILLRKGVVQGIGTHSYDFPIVAKFMKYRDRIKFLSFAKAQSDLPEDCLMCHRDFLLKHPEMCQKFVRASFRGWKKAFEDKPKAIHILTAWYKERNMMVDATVSMDQLCAFEEAMSFQHVLENNGKLSRKDYQFMIDSMVRAKLISKEKAPPYDEFYYPVLQNVTIERLKQIDKQAPITQVDSQGNVQPQPVRQTDSNKDALSPPSANGGKP